MKLLYNDVLSIVLSDCSTPVQIDIDFFDFNIISIDRAYFCLYLPRLDTRVNYRFITTCRSRLTTIFYLQCIALHCIALHCSAVHCSAVRTVQYCITCLIPVRREVNETCIVSSYHCTYTLHTTVQ
jgi:hypothetical protein